MQNACYSFGLEGQRHFLRPAAQIQAEVLEPFFENEGWLYDREYFEHVPALYRRREPTALGGLEVAGVVMCFLGTWTCFAKKIFDEVYERTLKRPIAAELDKLFNTIEVPAGKTIEYRDIIYLEDIDLVVVVRAIAKKDCGQDLQHQVMQAHRVAYGYIERHGRKAPIHVHNIIDGQVAVEPEIFSTLEEVKQHDRTQLKLTVRK